MVRQQWPWVLYPLDTPMRQMLDHVLGQLDIAQPSNIVETTSVQTTLNLLSNSQTLALLPEAIARRQVEQGTISVLSTPLVTQPLSHGTLTRKQQTPSANAQELIGILLASAKPFSGNGALVRVARLATIGDDFQVEGRRFQATARG
ncbi:LysR substrate-binding domain-containing protein [Pseudomonas sp.]|uniref:LysR substrate-binding domain-containing protein n=1 Tax=Pseudomonas sp. TaxID=306 RepID=UPI00299CFCA9|nr:LysR substrate-binding domain-containing protein [Pseudomonas sp.]MDX1366695.1 LysR substrate-binding domain-containing protein [Pseudomonas sp.]